VWVGSAAVIQNSWVLNNGDHFTQNMWSDGEPVCVAARFLGACAPGSNSGAALCPCCNAVAFRLPMSRSGLSATGITLIGGDNANVAGNTFIGTVSWAVILRGAPSFRLARLCLIAALTPTCAACPGSALALSWLKVGCSLRGSFVFVCCHSCSDNSDVDLILGSGENAVVSGNNVTHAAATSFAGLVSDATSAFLHVPGTGPIAGLVAAATAIVPVLTIRGSSESTLTLLALQALH
jgi:hypothetical protein